VIEGVVRFASMRELQASNGSAQSSSNRKGDSPPVSDATTALTAAPLSAGQQAPYRARCGIDFTRCECA